MALELWLGFVLASVIILIIPGPIVTLLVATGLGRGRAAALAMIPGVLLGDLVAMAGAFLGIGALLMASAALFTAVKWLGAAYLVWLGIKMWREAGRLGAPAAAPAGSLPLKAFLVTVLNPKSLLFFVAFVPQFTAPAAPIAPQLVVLGATFLVLSGLSNGAYALLGGGLAGVLGVPARRLAHRLGASALIGAGLLTASLRRA